MRFCFTSRIGRQDKRLTVLVSALGKPLVFLRRHHRPEACQGSSSNLRLLRSDAQQRHLQLYAVYTYQKLAISGRRACRRRFPRGFPLSG
jgi:hypothetical protein